MVLGSEIDKSLSARLRKSWTAAITMRRVAKPPAMTTPELRDPNNEPSKKKKSATARAIMLKALLPKTIDTARSGAFIRRAAISDESSGKDVTKATAKTPMKLCAIPVTSASASALAASRGAAPRMAKVQRARVAQAHRRDRTGIVVSGSLVPLLRLKRIREPVMKTISKAIVAGLMTDHVVPIPMAANKVAMAVRSIASIATQI